MIKGISLSSLDYAKASEQAYEFEFVAPGGADSGIFLSVLGSAGATVSGAINRLVNERRRQIAAQAAQASGRPGDGIVLVEDDVAFGQKCAAARLCGWRTPKDTEGLTPEQLTRFQGIEEAYTPELALRLCQSNAEIAAQIIQRADNMANFTKASPKA